VSEVSAQGLYPAEHRALRELHAATQHVASHWTRLGQRLGGAPAEPLERGAAAARALRGELAEKTAAFDLHGYPAAQGAGARAAGLRNLLSDRLLERNQALRVAVLDLQHVITLLDYLAALAEQRGDAVLAAWHRGWEARLREHEAAALAAVVALAEDPAAAIEPAEDSKTGRAGHGLANALGTLGERIDGSALGRAARRRSGGG
jgi:hypothetical protein